MKKIILYQLRVLPLYPPPPPLLINSYYHHHQQLDTFFRELHLAPTPLPTPPTSLSMQPNDGIEWVASVVGVSVARDIVEGEDPDTAVATVVSLIEKSEAVGGGVLVDGTETPVDRRVVLSGLTALCRLALSRSLDLGAHLLRALLASPHLLKKAGKDAAAQALATLLPLLLAHAPSPRVLALFKQALAPRNNVGSAPPYALLLRGVKALIVDGCLDGVEEYGALCCCVCHAFLSADDPRRSSSSSSSSSGVGGGSGLAAADRCPSSGNLLGEVFAGHVRSTPAFLRAHGMPASADLLERSLDVNAAAESAQDDVADAAAAATVGGGGEEPRSLAETAKAGGSSARLRRRVSVAEQQASLMLLHAEAAHRREANERVGAAVAALFARACSGGVDTAQPTDDDTAEGSEMEASGATPEASAEAEDAHPQARRRSLVHTHCCLDGRRLASLDPTDPRNKHGGSGGGGVPPAALKELSKLVSRHPPPYCTVYLNDNELASLAPGLAALRATLTQLDARHNRLQSLAGSGLEALSRLRRLYVGRNCLSDLCGIAALSSLEELHASGQENEHSTLAAEAAATSATAAAAAAASSSSSPNTHTPSESSEGGVTGSPGAGPGSSSSPLGSDGDAPPLQQQPCFGLCTPGGDSVFLRLPRLRVVHLDNVGLGDAAVPWLFASESLEVLHVAGNAIAASAPLVAAMAATPRLRTLCIAGNPVARVAAAAKLRDRIVAALPRLELLDASEVTPRERAYIKAVAKKGQHRAGTVPPSQQQRAPAGKGMAVHGNERPSSDLVSKPAATVYAGRVVRPVHRPPPQQKPGPRRGAASKLDDDAMVVSGVHPRQPAMLPQVQV